MPYHRTSFEIALLVPRRSSIELIVNRLFDHRIGSSRAIQWCHPTKWCNGEAERNSEFKTEIFIEGKKRNRSIGSFIVPSLWIPTTLNFKSLRISLVIFLSFLHSLRMRILRHNVPIPVEDGRIIHWLDNLLVIAVIVTPSPITNKS